MIPPSPPRFESVAAAIAVALVCAALFGGVAAAESSPAEVDSVDVTPDSAWAGTTENHTVDIAATNASGADGVTFEVDVSEWVSEDGDIERVELLSVDGTAQPAETPTHNGETVTFAIDEGDEDDFAVALEIEFAHPTDATVGTVGVTTESSDTAEAADIDIEGLDVGLAGTVDSTGSGATTELSLEQDSAPQVQVTVAALSGDELFEAFDGANTDTVERHGDGVVITEFERFDPLEVDFDDIHPGTYTFEFAALDSRVITTRQVSVEERDMDAEFDQDVYRSPAGDFVTVDVSLDGVDEAYLLVGADAESGDESVNNYLDILRVQGSTTITMNTRLMGTDVPTEEAYLSDGSVSSYLHEGDSRRFEEVTFEDADGRTVADDLTEFREELGMTPQPRPLQAERYRLVVGSDGDVVVRDDDIPDFNQPLARSNVLLTQPEIGEVTTYVAPARSANDIDEDTEIRSSAPADIETLRGLSIQRETVAKGDRLIVEIEATGLYGATHWFDDGEAIFEEGVHPRRFGDLLARHEGVVLDVEQTNGGPNDPLATLGFGSASDGEAFVLPERSGDGDTNDDVRIERFYLVVDTRDSGPFTHSVGGGDSFEIEFGYESPPEERYRFQSRPLGTTPPPFAPANDPDERGTEHYPYFADSETTVTETAAFDIEAATVEYDRTTVLEEPMFRNTTNATLSGTTNVAPATEVDIQLVATNRTDPTRITIEDIDLDENGDFNVSHDLSVLHRGEDVEVEFYAQDRLVDKRGAAVVDDPDDPAVFTITHLQNETTITEGQRLENVTATVTNEGNAADRKDIEFSFEGTDIEEYRRTIRDGESRTLGFEANVSAFPAGEYEYTVTTPDDEAVGTLLIEEGETEQPEESEDEQPAEGPEDGDDAAEDEAGGGDEGAPDEAPDEENPAGPFGFLGGIGARHAIGGAAVVGAAHVFGYWS